jgi:hypothetical protein
MSSFVSIFPVAMIFFQRVSVFIQLICNTKEAGRTKKASLKSLIRVLFEIFTSQIDFTLVGKENLFLSCKPFSFFPFKILSKSIKEKNNLLS